jgi:hypothetical protein
MKKELIAGIVAVCVLVVVLIVVIVLATTTYRIVPFIPIVFDLTTGGVFIDVLISSRRLRSVLSISSPVSYFSTQTCTTCVFQPYDPKLSGEYTNLGIQDTVTFGVDGVVKGFVGTDTVTIQQNTASGKGSACGYTSTSVKPALPLILENYLLVAAGSIVKAPLNQVGLSPLQFVNSGSPTSKAVHAVQPTRKYESSILENMHVSGMPVQWSLLLKPFGSQMWLGRSPPSGICPTKGPLSYTPLLPALPDAATPFFGDTGRYYAVRIAAIARLLPDGTQVPLTGSTTVPAPRIAIITLSQPLIVFPESPLADTFLKTSTTNLQGVAITFDGGPKLTVHPGASVWSYGGSGLNPIYGALPDADTKALSSKQDILILGCLAFQNTVMHFDLDKNVFGLAELEGGPL